MPGRIDMTRNPSLVSMPLIDAAIAHHGPRRVLFAALGAMLRRRSATLSSQTDPPLSNHLRRDIGLNAHAPPATWELMR